MMRLATCAAVLALTATAAVAQQRSILDPDDFVDPRTRGVALFVSHLVLGGGANLVDDYRPLRDNGPFLEVANSFYWSGFQIDHKHSRVYTANPPVAVCPCQPPLYFPTAPGPDATPAAPPQSSKETFQFARYLAWPRGGDPPVMLRYRLTLSRQRIDTTVRFLDTDVVASRLHGHEQSFGLDADTYFRIAGHDVWGSVVYSRNTRSGTADDRTQNELAYTSRFPAVAIHDVLFLRPQFTLGGVTGRGATGVNVVNPRLDVSWSPHAIGANFHLIYSPVATRSGAGGWETHHQIALLADRALFVKMFRRSAPQPAPKD
jgi:hypothetical protein